MASVFRNVSLDNIFRSATAYMSTLFSHGWGNIEILKQLSNFQAVALNKERMLNEVYKIFKSTEIKISEETKINSILSLYKGEFISPLTKIIPNALPRESEKVYFQIVLPQNWKDKKPVVIHLAGTGDHYFWRRRQFMATPLAKEYNIGSIILENPFYGYRKPKNQVRSSINYVSDVFVMGAALLVETTTILLWCQRNGFGPLGITGMSLGGHMATVSASAWFEPLAIIPCLSWSSAAPAFTEGVLSHTIQWDVLQKQLQEQPEYKYIIRNDSEFQRLLNIHYNKNSPTVINSNAQQVRPDVINPNTPQMRPDAVISPNTNTNDSRSNQIYKTFSSALSNLELSSYFDLRGKKIGPIALEIDLWKYIESVPRNVYNSTYNFLNVNYLRNFSITGNPEKPSQETVDYMTAIMDQATHLSHFNKPHHESPVIFVVADHDRYIPRECYHVTPEHIWAQTQVRNINSGHVLAILQHHNEFRIAIRDAFRMLGCNI